MKYLLLIVFLLIGWHIIAERLGDLPLPVVLLISLWLFFNRNEK